MKRTALIIIGLLSGVTLAALAADYRESSVTGAMTTWRRAANVTISNPYGGIPTLTFYEEDKIRLPDGTTMSGPGVRDPQIRISFNVPLTEFPLVNPATGEQIGMARHQDLYVLLYSLYLDLAAKRDAALVTPPPANPPITDMVDSAPMIESGSN